MGLGEGELGSQRKGPLDGFPSSWSCRDSEIHMLIMMMMVMMMMMMTMVMMMKIMLILMMMTIPREGWSKNRPKTFLVKDLSILLKRKYIWHQEKIMLKIYQTCLIQNEKTNIQIFVHLAHEEIHLSSRKEICCPIGENILNAKVVATNICDQWTYFSSLRHTHTYLSNVKYPCGDTWIQF